MSLENCTISVGSFQDAQELVAREDAATVQSNLDFYYSDHWQNSAGWSGPIPASTASEYNDIAYEIQRGFVSQNVIKEVVDRVVNGITGKKPIWTVTAKRGREVSQEMIDEATAVIEQWAERSQFNRYLSEAVRNALLSGKSTLRLHIPSGFVKEGSYQVNTENPTKHLFIAAPNPLSATVHECPDSRERVGVFIASAKVDGQDADVAELTYLMDVANERGMRLTEITLLPDRGSEQVSVQLDLSERLTMIELEMPRLTTEQIRSLQMFLNLNLTMMQRNSVLGGFLERIILNGQLPGHYETDAEGTKTFVRDSFSVGAGSVNAITGIPIANENGQITGYTPADIRYQQPVSVKTFAEAGDHAYRNILKSCDQLHAMISGDATTSGESRRQALQAFFASLRIPKEQVDKAGSWAFETVLAYDAFLTGKAGKYDDLKVTFDSTIDRGSLPAEEINLVTNQVTAGIISKRTARERLGIEDVDEEERRVQAEAAKREEEKPQEGGVDKDTGLPLENLDNNQLSEEE